MWKITIGGDMVMNVSTGSGVVTGYGSTTSSINSGTKGNNLSFTSGT